MARCNRALGPCLAGLVVLLPLPLAGCGADGDDPNAWGRARFTEAEGTFTVEYLAPPWELLHAGGVLRLRIRPEVFGYDVNVAASTHGLDIAPVDADDVISDLEGVEVFVPEDERFDPLAGLDLPQDEQPAMPLADVDLDDPFAVAHAELSHLAIEREGRIDFDLAETTNLFGQPGLTYQVVTQSDTFMRVVYMPSAKGVVRATLVSVFDIATADMDWMLEGFATDVTPPDSVEPSDDGETEGEG